MYQEFKIKNQGAELNCRRYGNGEPVIMIHGACTDSGFFSDAARFLSKRFAVFTYDRRGYSSSSCAEDADHSIEMQASDTAAIIRHIGEPCHIVGHSAGAVISTALINANPELVRRALLYEPPIADCMPVGHESFAKLDEISGFIDRGRYSRAGNHFLLLAGEADKRARPQTEEERRFELENMMTFVKHEFKTVFFYLPNYHALKSADIKIGLGEKSERSHHNPICFELSKRTGAEVLFFPGQHNCPYDLPREFAGMCAGVFLLD